MRDVLERYAGALDMNVHYTDMLISCMKQEDDNIYDMARAFCLRRLPITIAKRGMTFPLFSFGFSLLH